jgi:O-antigen/teichoic acid export membrane protein
MAVFIEKVKKSSIYTLAGTIAQQVAGVIITWLLIRELTLEDYGIYNLLAATASYLTVLSSFGLKQAFQRYLPEFYQKKEYAQFSWSVRFGLVFRALAAILSVSLIMLFFDKIGPFFQIGGYQNYFLIFSVGFLFALQGRFLEHILEAMFLHKYAVYAHITHVLIRLLLLFIVFYLGYGLLQVLIADVIAYLFLWGMSSLAYRLKGIRSMRGAQKSQEFSKPTLLKRLFRYSGFSMFNDVGKHFIDVSTDFFVISHFLGPSALAYYAFAARIGTMISRWVPSRLMRRVVAPTFFARYARSGDKKELDKMFGYLSKLNAFVMFPIFTLVAVFGVEIIQYVFDPQYETAYPVMMILLVFFMMLAFPMALPLQAIEKPEFVLIAKISSVYNLVMDIVLIQIWGIVGVAVATASAMVFKKLLEYILSRKHAGITIPWVGLIKIIMNCLVTAALGIWAKEFVSDVVSLAIFGILLLGTYLGVSYVNKVFLPEERNLINKAIGREYFVF